MSDDWYQYATLEHFWIKGRFRAAMQSKFLQQLNATRMLEIGCGNGLIIHQFEHRLNVVVDGSDLNMYALEQVGAIKGDLYCLNIFDEPKKLLNQYDGILLMDVIEHIDDDENFLRQSTRYLKYDGLAIINVPAIQGLFSKYDSAVGHKRRYDKQMLRRLFASCQIEEVSIRYWGLTLLPIAFLRKVILRSFGKDNIVSTGFRPPNNALNWILDKILSVESAVLGSPAYGSSIIAVGRYRPKSISEKQPNEEAS